MGGDDTVDEHAGRMAKTVCVGQVGDGAYRSVILDWLLPTPHNAERLCITHKGAGEDHIAKLSGLATIGPSDGMSCSAS